MDRRLRQPGRARRHAEAAVLDDGAHGTQLRRSDRVLERRPAAAARVGRSRPSPVCNWVSALSMRSAQVLPAVVSVMPALLRWNKGVPKKRSTLRDRLRDRRLRQVRGAGGGADAAALRDLPEDEQMSEIDLHGLAISYTRSRFSIGAWSRPGRESPQCAQEAWTCPWSFATSAVWNPPS